MEISGRPNSFKNVGSLVSKLRRRTGNSKSNLGSQLIHLVRIFPILGALDKGENTFIAPPCRNDCICQLYHLLAAFFMLGSLPGEQTVSRGCLLACPGSDHLYSFHCMRYHMIHGMRSPRLALSVLSGSIDGLEKRSISLRIIPPCTLSLCCTRSL